MLPLLLLLPLVKGSRHVLGYPLLQVPPQPEHISVSRIGEFVSLGLPLMIEEHAHV
jgi:hypothetical protein